MTEISGPLEPRRRRSMTAAPYPALTDTKRLVLCRLHCAAFGRSVRCLTEPQPIRFVRCITEPQCGIEECPTEGSSNGTSFVERTAEFQRNTEWSGRFWVGRLPS